MPLVSDILGVKGSTVFTISPAASVLDAIHKMNQQKLGALAVTESGKVVGMFTERDVLQRILGDGRDVALTRVAEVMTRDVHCCKASTDLDEVALSMTEKRIRHVPVCDASGELLGLISIGDINAFHVGHQEQTILQLNDYIYGRA